MVRLACVILLAGIAAPAIAAPVLRTLDGSRPILGRGGPMLTDSRSDGITVSSDVVIGSFLVNRFPRSMGILAGARVGLNVFAQLRYSGFAANRIDPSSGAGYFLTSRVQNIRLLAPLLTTRAVDLRVLGGGLSTFADPLAIAGFAVGDSFRIEPERVDPNTLFEYSGTGTAALSIAFTHSLNLELHNFTEGSATQEVSFGEPGSSVLAIYDYYDFANPAFSADGATALTLDFGTVALGGGTVTLDFPLFNLGPAGSARLDLDSIDSSGAAAFSTTLAPFRAAIDGGGSALFQAAFDPTRPGRQRGLIQLSLSDENLGFGTRPYLLTLNLTANVVGEVASPATAAVFGAGLVLLGAARRRRA